MDSPSEVEAVNVAPVALKRERRRTSRRSKQGGHYGLARIVVFPARPAAELCRSAAEVELCTSRPK